jgi:hypothetical protein
MLWSIFVGDLEVLVPLMSSCAVKLGADDALGNTNTVTAR